MGFIKLDRKMLNWGWKDDPNMVALWIHILLEANYKNTEWHGENYEEGSFPTSVEKLSVHTGLSTRSVRTCLEKLKKSGEIDIQTTNRGTKISVVKWAFYQGCDDDGDKPIDKQPTNNRQTTDKQPTTLKEYKNIRTKEYKKNNIYPTIDEIRSYCEERHNNVDANRFYDYYESCGWKVGKGKTMKDWRAAIRNWERNTKVRTEDSLPTYDTSKNGSMSRDEEEELLALMKGARV